MEREREKMTHQFRFIKESNIRYMGGLIGNCRNCRETRCVSNASETRTVRVVSSHVVNIVRSENSVAVKISFLKTNYRLLLQNQRGVNETKKFR